MDIEWLLVVTRTMGINMALGCSKTMGQNVVPTAPVDSTMVLPSQPPSTASSVGCSLQRLHAGGLLGGHGFSLTQVLYRYLAATEKGRHSKQYWEGRLIAVLLASKEFCNSAKAKNGWTAGIFAEEVAPVVSKSWQSSARLEEHEQLTYSSMRSKAPSVIVTGLKPTITYIFHIRVRMVTGYSGYSQKFEFETGDESKFHSKMCCSSKMLI
ncbi:uncharacterized protein LOC110291054 [Mus caroli]|uniref:Uncharacterized protein LOC110291054 n=1 Tax=Mus caroli TaxID=10089 RepID=A0A6P5PE28_MUSCR|nr:uncharacterized protein LOC110291054 [Mus caroli]